MALFIPSHCSLSTLSKSTKHNFLLSICLLNVLSSLYSQDLQFVDHDLVVSDELNEIGANYFSSTLGIVNNTEMDLELYARSEVIYQEPEEMSYNYHFGGVHIPSDYTSPFPVSILSGDTLFYSGDDYLGLEVSYSSDFSGLTGIRFYLLDESAGVEEYVDFYFCFYNTGENECEITLDIHDLHNKTYAYIFPNPATDVINLQTINLNEGDLSFNLTDLNEKELHKEYLNEGSSFTTIDISHLSSGIYLGSITSKKKIISRQRIILR